MSDRWVETPWARLKDQLTEYVIHESGWITILGTGLMVVAALLWDPRLALGVAGYILWQDSR